jgi:excisionase family DNA binding protein
MKKYKVIPAPDDAQSLEQLLNSEASQGWEFVSSESGKLVFVLSGSYLSSTINTNDMIGFENNELTTGQAAEQVGCTPQTIKNHIKGGKLKATLRGTRYAIKKEDLQAWRIANNF